MRTADFDYHLPPELIAQQPLAVRNTSRLLVVHRGSDRLQHGRFGDLGSFLRQGDVLVLNNSRVIPARLRGFNEQTGGRFEILLLEEVQKNEWWTMVRPGKRARTGTRICVSGAGSTLATALVLEMNEEGHRKLRFEGVPDLLAFLESCGEVPLPPYIERSRGGPQALDRERYQTVYAGPPGSVAAPTAGLHFTRPLLNEFSETGIQVRWITLHVGVGTFAPVKAERLENHRMHRERYSIPAQTAESIAAAKAEGRRVIAVGTTTLRVLESVARNEGRIAPGAGCTDIFIYPPFQFKIIDALLTNFHLPRSTLLMLVSAFASPGSTDGIQRVLKAYHEAIRANYRFFSYGDAMLLL